jgi:hypothetical protein
LIIHECGTCVCFKDDIFDLYHTDKIKTSTFARAIATCKTCHDDYYSPLDYHSPVNTHCYYSQYPDKCRQCDKSIIVDIDNNTTITTLPCTSFAWDWTAAVDRDSSFHYDFGFDSTCLIFLKEEIPVSLVPIIQGYLCLDIEKIKRKILDRGNKIDFRATTNGKGKWVISIYE